MPVISGPPSGCQRMVGQLKGEGGAAQEERPYRVPVGTEGAMKGTHRWFVGRTND